LFIMATRSLSYLAWLQPTSTPILIHLKFGFPRLRQRL
jgi:hypothetical protein